MNHKLWVFLLAMLSAAAGVAEDNSGARRLATAGEGTGSDFDGDGHSDILWHNTEDGRNIIWSMDGGDRTSARLIQTIPAPWVLAGLSDCDGDGTTDLLWRNTADGRNLIWFFEGGMRSGSALLPAADVEWRIAATPDIDGDGRSDILWRLADGRNIVWFIDGESRRDYRLLHTTQTNWELAGTGDFNGDGQDDLLWHNPADGRNIVWLMGLTGRQEARLVHSSTLTLAGVADFDGDGNDDILWRDTNTGRNILWFMADGERSSYGLVNPVYDLTWRIAALRDFDGDGLADIHWRTDDGRNILWFMNGAERIGAELTYSVADNRWISVDRESLAVEEPDYVAEALSFYAENISGQLIQDVCVVCHAVNRAATASALRFAEQSESGYQDSNFELLQDYVAEADGRAELIADKTRGVAHGGGDQRVNMNAGDYDSLVEFVGLLEALPDENLAAGCLSCHAPLNGDNEYVGIEDAHPGAALSCTDCHGGNASVLDKVNAHVAAPATIDSAAAARRLTSVELDAIDSRYIRWINPSDYRVVDETCGQSDCHEDISRRAPSSIMTTFAGHFDIPLYFTGRQDDRNAIYGVRDQSADVYVGEEGTSQMLETLETVVLTEDSSLSDFTTHYLDKGCPRCHVWNFGPNDTRGDFRSSGCAGCHMVYGNDGLSTSGDPTINRDDPAHAVKHVLTTAIPDSQCEHCHYRGNRIGTMYRGLRESARLEETPNRTTVQQSLHGHVPGFYVDDDDTTNSVDETAPDIHFTAGLGCIDCHVGGDVHGDGKLYSAHDLQVGIECTDCHGTEDSAAEPDGDGVFRNGKGFALRHLEAGVDGPVLRSPTDGEAHYPEQLVDLVGSNESPEFVASHIRNNDGFSHLDTMECYSCHSSWTQSCFGCHVTVDARENGKSLINGEETPGAIAGSRSWVITDYFALGLNAKGRITPMAPQEKMFFTAIVPCESGSADCTLDTETNAPGKLVFDQQVRRTHDDKLGMGFGPIVPHTVSATSQPCDRCHLREDESNVGIVNELIGRGSGRVQIPDGDGVMYDLTQVLDENDDPIVGLAHSGSDVLGKETIARILTPRVADSGLSLRILSDWASRDEVTGPSPPIVVDYEPPIGDVVPASSCDAAALEIANLEVGAATPEFSLLLNDSELPVWAGAQGGASFLRLIMRANGLYPGSDELGEGSYPEVNYELYVDDEQALTVAPIRSLFRVREDGQAELPAHNVPIDSLTAGQLRGEQARLEARVVDACGVTLTQSIGVTLTR